MCEVALSRRPFIVEQIAALEPFDFVAFIADRADGVGFAEVHRSEDGASYRVEAGAEPAAAEPALALLSELGLKGHGERRQADGLDSNAAAALVDSVLGRVFGCGDGRPLDVRHGSRRAEVEAQRRLAAVRARLEALLPTLIGSVGYEIDAENDFTFPFRSTRLFVAPRALEGGPTLVRVMALTNVDVEPSPALGLFLAQTNFELAVGRLAYDGPEKVVWFEIGMLGAFADEDLAFALRVVADMADDFDDRIMSLFGGETFNPIGEAAGAVSPGPKPGTGGYL